MNKQMFVGLAAEGTTDIRFLTSIVKRTLNEVAFQESRYNIDIYVNDIDVSKSGLSILMLIRILMKNVSEIRYCRHKNI